MVLMTLAALRLTGLLAGRRRPATKAVAVLSVVWVGAARSARQLVDPVPLASRSVAALVYQDADAGPGQPARPRASSRRRPPSTRSATPRTTSCSPG